MRNEMFPCSGTDTSPAFQPESSVIKWLEPAGLLACFIAEPSRPSTDSGIIPAEMKIK
jgi:hypothetical protein